MPIQPNLIERTLFYRLNMAPAPLMDLAGALSYRTMSTAARLGLFKALGDQALTPAELAQKVGTQERGTMALLQALATTGYVNESSGRYRNSSSTVKWLLDSEFIDILAAANYWDALLAEWWPPAPDIVRTGERPGNFYEWIEADPELSAAFQTMMVANATLTGPDIVKKLKFGKSGGRILDVAGGHGMFSIILCQHFPGLRATVLDSPTALETARKLLDQNGLTERIELRPADMWQDQWGEAFDGVLLFNLLHHFDIESNEKLLGLAAGALKTGGQVAILEQIEGNITGSASEAFVRLISLQYYLAVDGRTFSKEDIEGLLSRTGFKDSRFHKMTKAPGTNLIVGVKE